MKFFQKTWVAWLCTAAMIGAAVVIGLNKESAAVPEPGEVGLDTSLSTAQFADYIWDQAGVLSDSQERDICLYNANWVQRYDSLIALAVVDGVPEIIRAVREQFYRGASHIKLMATEILNRHEDIRLLFGTDMMITGPDYQVEQSEDIRYYEKRFGTMRALRALTGTANEVFALTTYQNPYPKGKIGVLEAGSYADLLLVDGDPTKSVSVLADTDHLRLIMKGGTVYKNTLC